MNVREQIKALRSLPCPDNNCDGKGTVCAGAYEHESGEVEYDLHQCQFCDYRDTAAKIMELMLTDADFYGECWREYNAVKTGE